MSSDSIIENPKFWQILDYLVELNENKEFDKLCEYFKLSPEMLNSLLTFLQSVNYPIAIENKSGMNWVVPPATKPNFTLHFNIMEWLAFQAHFPKISTENGKSYHDPIRKKLSMCEDLHKESDLYGPLSVLDVVKDHSIETGLNEVCAKDESQLIVENIEKAILEEKCLKLALNDKKTEFKLYPRKVVHLDGYLSLIAEDVDDHCLSQLIVSNISSIEIINEQYVKHFSNLEIIDFIDGIRAISENEIRLILKIYDLEGINLEPAHLHMANPCLVTNSKGEKIWASSVEPCEAVMEWIFSMGRKVEIIDPNFFREKYFEYCQKKLKESA